MSYATYDFTESLSRANITPSEVERVVYAWGKGDGQGEDAGHYRWAEDGVTDWAGGFLLRMVTGGFVYLTGWCDYTGWGCQDGVEVYPFETQPSFDMMRETSKYKREPAKEEWDPMPADLNRWLANPVETR